MIDLFNESNLEELWEAKAETCISIYIPTHQEGLEVNENMDKISFKNEIQKIRQQLESYGFQNREIDKLLKPAINLIDDLSFWKDQSQGLAAFIKEGFFQYFRLPISFKNFSLISKGFELTPLIPVLALNENFFILSLNQYDFKLFKCNAFSINEIEVNRDLKDSIEESLIPFEYKNDVYTQGVESRKRELLSKTIEKGDINISEYFHKVNDFVISQLKEEKAPLVIAAVDEWIGDYKKANKYPNLWPEAFCHNSQFLNEKELHQNVLEVLKTFYNKPKEIALRRFSSLAGTGKTSTVLDNIMVDALAGRVESLFIAKDDTIWGRFDQSSNSSMIDGSPFQDNYNLLNEAAKTTFENSGRVFVLDKNEIPDQSSIAAIYRY